MGHTTDGGCCLRRNRPAKAVTISLPVGEATSPAHRVLVKLRDDKPALAFMRVCTLEHLALFEPAVYHGATPHDRDVAKVVVPPPPFQHLLLSAPLLVLGVGGDGELTARLPLAHTQRLWSTTLRRFVADPQAALLHVGERATPTPLLAGDVDEEAKTDANDVSNTAVTAEEIQHDHDNEEDADEEEDGGEDEDDNEDDMASGSEGDDSDEVEGGDYDDNEEGDEENVRRRAIFAEERSRRLQDKERERLGTAVVDTRAKPLKRRKMKTRGAGVARGGEKGKSKAKKMQRRRTFSIGSYGSDDGFLDDLADGMSDAKGNSDDEEELGCGVDTHGKVDFANAEGVQMLWQNAQDGKTLDHDDED